jgi:hypothetical protein
MEACWNCRLFSAMSVFCKCMKNSDNLTKLGKQYEIMFPKPTDCPNAPWTKADTMMSGQMSVFMVSSLLGHLNTIFLVVSATIDDSNGS